MMTFDKWAEVLGLTEAEVEEVSQLTTATTGGSSVVAKRPRTTSTEEPDGMNNTTFVGSATAVKLHGTISKQYSTVCILRFFFRCQKTLIIFSSNISKKRKKLLVKV